MGGLLLFYPPYLESTSNSFPPWTEFPDRMPDLPSPVVRTAEKAGSQKGV
jgi:hypothetical protein